MLSSTIHIFLDKNYAIFYKYIIYNMLNGYYVIFFTLNLSKWEFNSQC